MRSIASLLGGTAVAVGVAWIVAALADPFATHRGVFVHGDRLAWWVTRGDGPGSTAVHSLQGDRSTGRVSMADNHLEPDRMPVENALAALPWWLRIDPPQREAGAVRLDRHRVDMAFGWPLPCLRVEYGLDHGTRFVVRSGGLPIGGRDWTLPPYAGPPALPLRPVWRGLVANALLFGAGLFAIASGIAAGRAAARRRAGRCAACGYERRGLASDVPCPECGGASALGRR